MAVKRKRAERERGRGKEEEEDELLKLKLWSDTWDVMKKLNKSDLADHLRRVILPIDQVKKHVLPFLTRSERQEVEEADEGLTVRVDDLNTGSHYFLSFKKWESSGSYILGRHWNRLFVDRRKLGKDDVIGMDWNQSTRGFCFSVIKRSPTCHPPDPSLCEFAREHLSLSPPTPFSVINRSPAYPPPDPSLCEFACKHLRLSPPTPDLFTDALESCPYKN